MGALGARRAAGMTVRKVAVVGGECTGKSTLCERLAEELPGLWVPEYLREFTDRADRPPVAAEEAGVLAEQIAREASALDAARGAGLRWVACDSAPIATAIHAEMYFNDRGLFAAAASYHASYALTLLMDLDLAWIADGIQRDGPAVRADFHARMRAWLEANGVPYALVRGHGSARTASAIARVRAVESAPR